MKIRNLRWMSFVVLSFLMTRPALALVSGQLFYGLSSYDKQFGSTSSLSADGPSVGVHLDPIPLVPVAFGASYSQVNFSLKDLPSAKSVSLTRTALEVEVWVPMVPVITPYGRAGYLIDGKADFKTKADVVVSTKLEGYELALGIKYSIIPLVKALFEVGSNSYSNVDSSSDTLNAKQVRIGVEVGI
ncbi:MAG: hypothetical protein KA436_05785 [Oligoflexales bacterium]|nr:hypothetical protein [Oligoflexales bacterium]